MQSWRGLRRRVGVLPVGSRAEEDRVAAGTGVQEQIARGADVREQNRRPAPDRDPVSTAEHNRVPDWLQTGAAWSWRLLLLAAAIYLISRAIGVLYIVVVPCTAALLLTALLQPLTARLRHVGLPPLAATWCTLLAALAVVGGLALLVTNRVTSDG